MTKAQFLEMANGIVGSGTYEDGEKFMYYVSGSSVIVMTTTNESWFWCKEYKLNEDGEPYLYAEYPEHSGEGLDGVQPKNRRYLND